MNRERELNDGAAGGRHGQVGAGDRQGQQGAVGAAAGSVRSGVRVLAEGSAPGRGGLCQGGRQTHLPPSGPRLPAGDVGESRNREENQPPQAAPHRDATNLLNAGAERVDIQALLDHESVATTQIDTHVGPAWMEQVVGRL